MLLVDASFEVPYFLHFEPSLDALSLRSDVISSIEILSILSSVKVGTETSLASPTW